MFGGMEEMQKQMKESLSAIVVEAESGDGAIKVKANATREILDIKIDPSLDLSDKEQLEDLMLEAINRVLVAAAIKEQEASQAILSKMLPPGLDLGGLFGN